MASIDGVEKLEAKVFFAGFVPTTAEPVLGACFVFKLDAVSRSRYSRTQYA